MLLDAQLLLFYQRCNRRAFLDVYGDPSRQDQASDYLLKLMRDSWEYHRTVLRGWNYHQLKYIRGDWQAGAEATRELMGQGVDCIHKGVLLYHDDRGVTLLSRPDLLVKCSTADVQIKSDLGPWSYIPHQIKLGKRPKLDYQIVAAFHAWVLAQVQGLMPETSILILRGRSDYQVNLAKLQDRFHQTLNACIQMLLSRTEPEVFISRQRCNLCHWYSSCYATAKSELHLSLLAGVTPSRYDYLQTLGLTTVASLAAIEPAVLEPELSGPIARQLVLQAKSTLTGKALVKSDLTLLPVAPVEIYFDIEAEPELDLDYLLGLLVVDRSSGTDRFYPLLAEKPVLEQSIWEQFLELVWRYPDAPIFHFCDYEVKTVRRLARRYQTPSPQWEPLLTRLVDVHQLVTQGAILPVESYSLKSIARWVGFEWRDSDASGAQSLYWYDQWQQTGDRAFGDAIVRYNEDDCRATQRVKDWLWTFLGDRGGEALAHNNQVSLNAVELGNSGEIAPGLEVKLGEESQTGLIMSENQGN